MPRNTYAQRGPKPITPSVIRSLGAAAPSLPSTLAGTIQGADASAVNVAAVRIKSRRVERVCVFIEWRLLRLCVLRFAVSKKFSEDGVPREPPKQMRRNPATDDLTSLCRKWRECKASMCTKDCSIRVDRLSASSRPRGPASEQAALDLPGDDILGV